MAWVFPLKENKCEAILNCFKSILKKCGDKPERLNTDRGSELICKKFNSFFKTKRYSSLSELQFKKMSCNRAF